jgi:hypothetical protein
VQVTIFGYSLLVSGVAILAAMIHSGRTTTAVTGHRQKTMISKPASSAAPVHRWIIRASLGSEFVIGGVDFADNFISMALEHRVILGQKAFR